ncbi:distal tail protein Dit [Virgibacillus salarius]
MNFNGIDLQPYFRIISVTGRGVTEYELTTVDVPKMPGVYYAGKKRPPRIISVEIQIRGKNREEIRKKIDELNGILDVNEAVPIIFPDEPDMTYFGIPEFADEGNEYTFKHNCRLTIYCPDPYKYGEEQSHEFASDTFTVQNEGTAEAKPIIELEVLEPVTFAMVQNQKEEYQLIGKPVDASEEVVNTKTLLLEERGQTLDTWSDSPTQVDGGIVTGYLSTDNDGITVPSYGPDTDSGWHGPALVKEVNPTQDFEVEMMLEGETGKPLQTFRIEFYLFDEGMNVLGKMAILDKSLGINKKVGEGRIGPFISRQENYLISSENYSYGWPFYFGMLRMRRVGNQFEFYITRIANNTKHVYSLKKTFTDLDNQYAGKLKYVQIHIGKYADTDRAYGPKINHIKVYHLAQIAVDQTPYIAYPNDIITFDHPNSEILINGEDRKDLKDFGGSFFSLGKGKNQLVVYPSNSFIAKTKHRPRYR